MWALNTIIKPKTNVSDALFVDGYQVWPFSRLPLPLRCVKNTGYKKAVKCLDWTLDCVLNSFLWRDKTN